MYDSGMYSLRSLTEKLYEEWFRNKTGKKVGKSVIEYILKNIFYTGVFKFEDKLYENASIKLLSIKNCFTEFKIDL